MQLQGILAAHKTYVIASLAIAGAVFGYLDGDLDFSQVLATVTTALGGAAMKHDIVNQVSGSKT